MNNAKSVDFHRKNGGFRDFVFRKYGEETITATQTTNTLSSTLVLVCPPKVTYFWNFACRAFWNFVNHPREAAGKLAQVPHHAAREGRE